MQEKKAQGLSDAEARTRIEREYIAEYAIYTRHPSSSYVARHKPNDDKGNLTQRHIELSPQAIEDFGRVMQQQREEKARNSDIYNLFQKHHMPYDHQLARSVTKTLWEKEVKNIQETGLVRTVAERKANKEYLNSNSAVVHLNLGKNLSPRALNDFENALIATLLEREKAGRQ